MLLTRILSALVLAPIAIAAILIGGWALAGALAVALGIAAVEYTRLMERGGFHPARWLAVALIVALLLDPLAPQAKLAPAAISLALIGSLVWHMAHRSATVVADWALTLAGGLYLGWAGRHFIQIRALENGAAWLLLVLAGVWLADSSAYLVGVRWGRHKLAPALSPNKSWEGLFGGIAFAVVGNGLLAAALRLPPLHGAALGLLGGTLGTLGDLAISMMKRQVGAKDSGHLIPGHGGALDRIDSMLFAVIAGYLYLTSLAGLT
jgi:phosphatidate cytidylyltransferase